MNESFAASFLQVKFDISTIDDVQLKLNQIIISIYSYLKYAYEIDLSLCFIIIFLHVGAIFINLVTKSAACREKSFLL